VRCLFDHRDDLDRAELDRFAPNPYDYQLEDRLIVSYREWSKRFEEGADGPV
jgi:hypothetical protein